MECSSNPPLPSLVQPTFPPSTTASVMVLSPCLSERNVFTCGDSSLSSAGALTNNRENQESRFDFDGFVGDKFAPESGVAVAVLLPTT